jgi:hypothetical protein
VLASGFAIELEVTVQVVVVVVVDDFMFVVVD